MFLLMLRTSHAFKKKKIQYSDFQKVFHKPNTIAIEVPGVLLSRISIQQGKEPVRVWTGISCHHSGLGYLPPFKVRSRKPQQMLDDEAVFTFKSAHLGPLLSYWQECSSCLLVRRNTDFYLS